MKLPAGIWGEVVRPPTSEPELSAVRIEPASGRAFLVLRRERGVVSDTWVESEQDVLDYPNGTELRWPASPS